MSQQAEPIELARRKAQSLETTLDSVRTKATLSTIYDALDDIDSQLNALPGRLAQARRRGYVFKSYLEPELEALQGEWPATRIRVKMEADEQRPRLIEQMDALQQRFVRRARSLKATLIKVTQR